MSERAGAVGTVDSAYDDELSEVYDLVYRGRGKDFATEAAAVARVVRERLPAAASLLDVACGTGEHLVHLREEFAEVAGLELSPGMLAAAERKLPGVDLHLGDMRRFRLGRSFDAVCCLFSSIGYMASAAELDAAVARMADHLRPGGVLVIDPWWFPERFLDGYVSDAVVRDGDRTVARIAQSVRVGDAVRQEAHYVVADRAGVRHFVNVQWVTLFARAEYLAAIDRAGCDGEYLDGDDPRALSGRGLFVGVRR
ncbi:MAG TPA: class I SAM-dependent methyltransferase [Micromonosporaceae bacterium]|nr:class I SAM-dependent methyltransferase [Micromonosporaceae bacterium]